LLTVNCQKPLTATPLHAVILCLLVFILNANCWLRPSSQYSWINVKLSESEGQLRISSIPPSNQLGLFDASGLASNAYEVTIWYSYPSQSVSYQLFYMTRQIG